MIVEIVNFRFAIFFIISVIAIAVYADCSAKGEFEQCLRMGYRDLSGCAFQDFACKCQKQRALSNCYNLCKDDPIYVGKSEIQKSNEAVYCNAIKLQQKMDGETTDSTEDDTTSSTSSEDQTMNQSDQASSISMGQSKAASSSKAATVTNHKAATGSVIKSGPTSATTQSASSHLQPAILLIGLIAVTQSIVAVIATF